MLKCERCITKRLHNLLSAQVSAFSHNMKRNATGQVRHSRDHGIQPVTLKTAGTFFQLSQTNVLKIMEPQAEMDFGGFVRLSKSLRNAAIAKIRELQVNTKPKSK